MTAPTSAVYRMADQILEGQLAQRITDHRAAGLSWDNISRRLYDEAGLEVSSETLRKWAAQLGIEKAA